MQSPELVVQTPQPDFHLLGPATNIVVQAGGIAQNISIDVESSSNLPYDPLFFVDYDHLPQGIYVEFLDEVVSTRGRVQTGMGISVGAGLPPGHYAVPIAARSGEFAKMLTLSIEVVERENTLFLPLVSRKGE